MAAQERGKDPGDLPRVGDGKEVIRPIDRHVLSVWIPVENDLADLGGDQRRRGGMG